MNSRPSLIELCRLLLKHAAFTVGGGSVTTIALERDLVEHNHWLSLAQFRTTYGLARLTPGTSILALATGLGWEMHRWPGALLALACATIPGSILAALLAAAYQQLLHNDVAQRFLAGTAAAVCGLIAASIWRMVSPYVQGSLIWSTCIIFAFVLVLAILGISPFPVFIALGVVGYLMQGERS